MNTLLLLSSLLLLLSPTSGEVPEPTSVLQYPQIVDHYSYSPEASQTFSQRLWEYNKHWEWSPDGTVGPLFVYTGNEGPIDSFYYNTGFMFEIAPKFGALILFIEHRQVEEITHFLTSNNNSSIFFLQNSTYVGFSDNNNSVNKFSIYPDRSKTLLKPTTYNKCELN